MRSQSGSSLSLVPGVNHSLRQKHFHSIAFIARELTMKLLKHSTKLTLIAVALLSSATLAADSTLLVEAESFKDRGGWVLDTQFVHLMGSPYSRSFESL